VKELQEIIARHRAAQSAGQAAALATVVRVAGSTYRRPGARMFITDDGRVTGCVSGGCLEQSVFDQARRVLHTGQPRLVAYDSTADDEIASGLGLGCNGVVEVLIEPLTGGASDLLAFIAECFERRAAGAIATVIGVEGRIDAKLADRIACSGSGIAFGEFAQPQLQSVAMTALQRFDSGSSESLSVELLTGRADLFVERIQPPLPLLIFGAGHDALPLVRIGKELGWHVTLIDHRPANLARARSAGADAVVSIRPTELRERLAIDPRGAAIVMNHNFTDDLETLRALLASPIDYIGVLGPRQRTDRLLADLRESGFSSDTAGAARLHAPVGLNIGADNPEEIALAIAAEIVAARRNRAGGSLRDYDGPLHARPGEPAERCVATDAVVEVTCGLAEISAP
jgi:xanthine dehydrogenase accessory factor